MYGFSFGYYTLTYILYVWLFTFSLEHDHINYVSLTVHGQVIWHALVFALICVVSRCDLSFHIRAIMCLLCCVTWFSDMWCYLHMMFVISKYGFFSSHETNYVFAVLCDSVVVFWLVLLFALGVCDFKMWLTFVEMWPLICCFAGSESVYDLAGLVTIGI